MSVALRGTLYGPGPGPGEPCEVDVEAHRVVARAASRTVVLPLEGAALDVAGHDGNLVSIEVAADGGHVVLHVPRGPFEARLGGRGPGAHGGAGARIARESGRRRNRLLAGWAAGLGALALIVAGSVFAAGAAVEWFVGAVPPEWEAELGASLMEAAAPAGARIEDGPLAERLRLVVARLEESAPPSPYDFHVVLVRAEEPNAFALPGGHLAIHDALVRQCEGPDELAGVVAHEMEHVRRRHHLRALAHRLKWSLLLSALTGDMGTAQEVVVERASGLLLLGHDREQEREADRGAVDLTWAAGFDPAGMIRVFERFAAEEASIPGAATLLSTHPGGAERAELVRRLMAERGGAPPLRPLESWPALE